MPAHLNTKKMKTHKKRNKQKEKNDLRKLLIQLLDQNNTELYSISSTSAELILPGVAERTYTITLKERFCF